ncbi:hypothetical protein Krac_8956 [Ktedonobacter racemifer DSM 44963]|uniref:Uncharacterized protein n=1 Tax=Ktedonobacter racemifer DSM 44963 TaxID=485913 RepID=D6TQ28_KTERA|nr:hypothetical protein Krac_8956 [Ktedonobacter racemifer DSM 44963]
MVAWVATTHATIPYPYPEVILTFSLPVSIVGDNNV